MKNAAIIGCGAIAPVHAHGIDKCQKSNLYAVCDIDKEKVINFAKENKCKYYFDYKELLKDENIDVVHICTPHFLHAKMAVDSLQSGKNVILEKPLAISEKEAYDVIEAEKRTGKRLGCCFQNRYNMSTLKIKEFIESGKGGKILGAKAILNWHRTLEYYTESSWRGKWETEGGGVLINQAIHTFDLLIYFFGEIKNVSGNISSRLLDEYIEVENCAEGIIEFECGVNALFYTTLCYCMDSPAEIEIVFENAVLSLKENLSIKYKNEIQPAEKYYDADSELIGKNYWGTGHSKLIDDFYQSLDAQKAFMLSANESIKALKLVFELYKMRN